MRKKETDTKVSVSFFSHCRDIGRSVHNIHGCLDACALGIGAHDRADLLGDAALAADDLTHILGGNAQLQRQLVAVLDLGHGDLVGMLDEASGFRMMVFAPATVQEAVDMTYAAFDYAQRDRNPVLILADGVLGTIMEPVELPEMRSDEEIKRLKDELSDWALVGHSADKKALILPGGWAGQEDRCKRNAAMYDTWEKDVQVEEFMTEDAELILVAYGVCGRISKSAVRILRTQGYKVGLIRPKTVSPWPYASFDKLDYSKVKAVLDVEMSIPAQLVLDVTLAVKDRCPIHTCLRSGGEIMSRDHVVAAAKAILDKEGA